MRNRIGGFMRGRFGILWCTAGILMGSLRFTHPTQLNVQGISEL